MKSIIQSDAGVLNWFSDQFAQLTPLKMVIALAMGLLVGLIIAFVYRKTYRGVLFLSLIHISEPTRRS